MNNFQSFEVVDRGSETQIQMTEQLNRNNFKQDKLKKVTLHFLDWRVYLIKIYKGKYVLLIWRWGSRQLDTTWLKI